MGEQVAAGLNGGVAQLGEHLPCKQGVKSSNLSVSSRQREAGRVYLEKSIQRRYKTSETERISTRTGIAWKCKATGMGGHAGHTRQRYAAVWGTGQAGRAQGGCLGTKSRRKTRQAAKSCGEGHMPGDPQVSEWGNPHGGSPHVSMRQHITHGGEPGELKHLSSRRKRKKHRFPE